MKTREISTLWMDTTPGPLDLVFRLLNDLCNIVSDTPVADKILLIKQEIEDILGTLGTKTCAKRPTDLPTNKRKKHDHAAQLLSGGSDGSECGLPPTPCDKKSPCHQEELYQKVLRKNHLDLMEDLQLDSSELLDNLVTHNVLGVADAESLRRIPNRRKKTRTFLTQLAGYGQKKFENFKNALKPSHKHLFVKIDRTLQEMEYQNGVTSVSSVCLTCKIAKNVEICDVVDKLYTYGILERAHVQDINSSKLSRHEAWNIVFRRMQSQKCYGLKILKECLADSYPDITTDLEKEKSYCLKCNCVQNRVTEGHQNSVISNDMQPAMSDMTSEPCTVSENQYMSLPYDCNYHIYQNEHTYEKCLDVDDSPGEAHVPLYANIQDLRQPFQSKDMQPHPLTINDCQMDTPNQNVNNKPHRSSSEPPPSQLSETGKENGDKRQFLRGWSWDNGIYYHKTEIIECEIPDDPTYIHPCSFEDSQISPIRRKGAFRRKFARTSE